MDVTFPTITAGDAVVLDTETTGLSWQECRTCGFVVTVEDDGKPKTTYYPIRHEKGPNLDPERVISWIKSWSHLPIKLIGHNLKFDLHFLANDGIYFPNAEFEDTQTNGTLIYEHMKGGFSLENQCYFFGTPAKKGEALYEHMAKQFGGNPERAQMANFWRLSADDPIAVDYACGDGDATYYLWKKQQDRLDADDLRRVWHTECQVLPVLFRMERRGVRIDEERLAYVKAWTLKQIEMARVTLPEGMNVLSAPSVKKVMLDSGITDYPVTPKGNPSFTAEWLEAEGGELGANIIKVRKLENLLHTFIEGAIENNLFNGRVHTNFNQLRNDEYGTITGRLSSNGPNMQQVPKRDKWLAPILRTIFVPDEGCLWSTNDYSQQEYRVFAAYAHCPSLIKGYQRGEDIHSVVAQMLNCERDPTAKRLNMAMLNWMGAKTFSTKFGCSVKEANEYLNIYHSRIPETMIFLRKCQSGVRSRGYIKTILGRRARFEDRGKGYQGSSRVIQGTCADLTKIKMVEVDKYLDEVSGGVLGLQLQVHDALDWSIPPEHMDWNQRAIEIMEDFSMFPKLYVPMTVEGNVGESWGHASFPKQDWSKYE